MEEKIRDGVALRFAENLVGQMLQRSGTEFYPGRQLPSAPECDFVVKQGKDTYPLEVQYLDDAIAAQALWRDWRRSAPATTGAKAPAHLVVVTGNGDRVFADPIVMPLLAPDQRTQLSTFE